MSHYEVFHMAGVSGIPWPTILQWLETYALPIVIQVLSAILPLLLAGKVTVAQAVQWAGAALAALALGQPMPALP